MAHFDPSELDGNSDYKMSGGDDEKKMANDLNLGFNEMEAIREEIKKKQPLVSDVVPLSNLLDEFKEQPNFRRQIKTIIDAKTHSNYRPMRQDGNCFYRAFLLALFETIEKSQDSQLLATVSEQAFSSLHRLLKFHYESFTIEDFYDTFMDELKWLQKKMTSDAEYKADDGMGNTSTDRLRNEFHSQSLIFWARMLASVHIQENKEDFAGFIQGKSLHEFIKSDVEALHAEADHPQFSALSAVLNVPFRVYCLENIDKGGPQIVHSLGENRKPIFDLLFRPGHYDIIYRSQNYDAIVNQEIQQTMGSSYENNNNGNADKNNGNSEMKSNTNVNNKEKENANKTNKDSNKNKDETAAKNSKNGNGNNAKNNNNNDNNSSSVNKSSNVPNGKLNGNT